MVVKNEGRFKPASEEEDVDVAVCACAVLKAVERINAAIRAGVPEKTVEELMNPEAQLPEVYPSAADLYQRELASLQQQSPEVPQTSARPNTPRHQRTTALWAHTAEAASALCGCRVYA